MGASLPGTPTVDAGDDIVTCGGSTVISADFLNIGETTSYDVVEIPFAPPFAFSGLGQSVDPGEDDQWYRDPITNITMQPLPFDFCFYGLLEQEFKVGANGVIAFHEDVLNDFSNAWSGAGAPDIPSNGGIQGIIGEPNVHVVITIYISSHE